MAGGFNARPQSDRWSGHPGWSSHKRRSACPAAPSGVRPGWTGHPVARERPRPPIRNPSCKGADFLDFDSFIGQKLPRVETRPEQQVHAPHSLGPVGTHIPPGGGRPGYARLSRRDFGGESRLAVNPARAGARPRAISRLRASTSSRDRIKHDHDRTSPCHRKDQVPISSDIDRPDFQRKRPENSSTFPSKVSPEVPQADTAITSSDPHDRRTLTALAALV